MSKFKTHDPHSLDHELLQDRYPPEEAIALQERWRQILAVQSGDPHNTTVQDITKIRLVVGLDIAYPPTPDPTLGIAWAVLWDVPAVKMVSFRIVTGPISFSYIPGLLGFREALILEFLKNNPPTPKHELSTQLGIGGTDLRELLDRLVRFGAINVERISKGAGRPLEVISIVTRNERKEK